MTETKRPLKVFLCHAHHDKAKTRELYRYLRRRGVQPWLDAEDLVGGQDWRVEIPKAIRSSDAIIICLSKNSINREGFVQAEITFALEKALEIPSERIFIIPARFEDCDVPDKLERYHWVDLFEEDGFPRLMKSLKTRASQLERASVQIPKPDDSSPDLASTWEEKAALVNAERRVAEKAEREATERGVHAKEELEAVEKPARQKVEREAAEKVTQEKVLPLLPKPITEQKPTGTQSLSKRDVQIIAALVILIITIYVTLTSSSVRNFFAQTSKPTSSPTINVVIIRTSAAKTANAQFTQNAIAVTKTPKSFVPTVTMVTNTPISSGFDFHTQASAAIWISGAGNLTFGGPDTSVNGFAMYRDGQKLEDGVIYAKVLETQPQFVTDGVITGRFPTYTVVPGERFTAEIGFLPLADGSCGVGNVKFQLNYKEGAVVKSLGEWAKSCDGTLKSLNVDLTNLAGKTAEFVLVVLADGPPTQDWAVWVNPEIALP